MSGLKEGLLVAAGGAAGAAGRWWVSGLVHRWAGIGFPWGTLAVNLLGSFALGFLMAAVGVAAWAGPHTRLVVGAGFLGAFTTFSTFSYETARLLEAGAVGRALVNAGGSLVLGLLACVAGIALARTLLGGG